MQYFTTIQIDDVNYNVQQFTATKSVKTFARLAKMLGVPFAMMLKNKEQDVDDALPIAIGKLFEGANENDLDALLKSLMSSVMINSQPIYDEVTGGIYDTHFQGRIGALIRLAVEVVKFQYKDFLQDIAKYGGVHLKVQPAAQA